MLALLGKSMSEKKPIKIEFAPGCFDAFEGTQEELDSLIKEITDRANAEDFEQNVVPLEDLLEDWSEEDLAEFGQLVSTSTGKRTLN